MDYCDKFRLREHIKLQHKVQRLLKSEDYEVTGCWELIVSTVYYYSYAYNRSCTSYVILLIVGKEFHILFNSNVLPLASG